MLTEKEILTRWWMTFDNLVKLIDCEKDFVSLLKDIQQGYIIKRWLKEWDYELAKMMWWIEACDDIITKLSTLDQARIEYLEKKQEEEKEKNKV